MFEGNPEFLNSLSKLKKLPEDTKVLWHEYTMAFKIALNIDLIMKSNEYYKWAYTKKWHRPTIPTTLSDHLLNPF